jgi:hypothetical protein
MPRLVAILHPACEEVGQEPLITIDGSSLVLQTGGNDGPSKYYCDTIFGLPSSQGQIFQTVAEPAVLDALAGKKSAAFIAFGASGAGKTFAITGGAKKFSHRGIIPRAISFIFDELQRRGPEKYEIKISFMELYKDQVIDLLAERPRSKLSPQAAASPGLFNGVSVRPVASESEAYHLLFQGDSNRHFEKLPDNPETSRGHTFFNLAITNTEEGWTKTLYCVDIAAPLEGKDQASVSVSKSIFSLRAAVISLASTSRRADDPVWGEHPLTMALAPVLVDAGVEVVALAAVKCVPGCSEAVRTSTAEWLQFGALLASALRRPAESGMGFMDVNHSMSASSAVPNLPAETREASPDRAGPLEEPTPDDPLPVPKVGGSRPVIPRLRIGETIGQAEQETQQAAADIRVVENDARGRSVTPPRLQPQMRAPSPVQVVARIPSVGSLVPGVRSTTSFPGQPSPVLPPTAYAYPPRAPGSTIRTASPVYAYRSTPERRSQPVGSVIRTASPAAARPGRPPMPGQPPMLVPSPIGPSPAQGMLVSGGIQRAQSPTVIRSSSQQRLPVVRSASPVALMRAPSPLPVAMAPVAPWQFGGGGRY